MKPAVFDQRLIFPRGQNIDTHREAFYLDGSYFCENNSSSTSVFSDNVKYAMGMYSSGKSLKSITEYLRSIVPNLDLKQLDINKREDYYLLSSFICMARLLDVEELDTVTNLQSLSSMDRLLDIYINGTNEPNIEIPILHQDPYLFLSMELTRDDSYIESFCRNFFHSMKAVSWYESHRNNTSKFFGYWSFELAFLVRFLEVDDTAFIDHMYYPRDLAHKKWIPSWREDEQGEKARLYKTELLISNENISVDLTKEMIQFIEGEMNKSEKIILSSSVLNNFISKVAESKALMANIEGDPTENEMSDIQDLINDLVKIVSEYSGGIKKNEYLDDLEKEITSQVIKQFDRKSYPGNELEKALNTYLNSDAFDILKGNSTKNLSALSSDLAVVQEIEDKEKYWDKLEELLDKYGFFNLDESKVKESKKDPKVNKSNKSDGSFKISFNDYL